MQRRLLLLLPPHLPTEFIQRLDMPEAFAGDGAKGQGFEQLGGTYTRQGDYCLPDVCLPPEEERPIGVYGQRRRAYLKEHHRVLYYNLLAAGMLDGHLADIEEQAQELFSRMVKQHAVADGVTEALKADDPMAWVRKMNGIRQQANEVVMQEIVYG